VSTKIITKSLKCLFSQEELDDLAHDMSVKLSEIYEIELEKKNVTSQLKAKMDNAESDLRLVKMNFDNGFEYRDIDCEVRMDFIAGMVVTTRIDTGEVIDNVPMTAAERQLELNVKPVDLDNTN
jgi:hypothetical protein